MLHECLNRFHHFFNASGEGRAFPTSRMSFNTQTKRGSIQARKSQTIVIYKTAVRSKRFLPSDDQVISMDTDVRSSGPAVGFKQLDQLRL